MSKIVLYRLGSIRQGSFNHQMALEAESTLCGKVKVSYLDYFPSSLQLQDLEVPTHTAVAAAREASRFGDAIWIFSSLQFFYPWYSKKLLLDAISCPWLVFDTRGVSPLKDKCVRVSSVANAGHETFLAI